MREVARRPPRALGASTRELYGDNVAPKIERCLARDRRRGGRGRRAARGATATRCSSCSSRFDLLLTPTLAFVAPPAGRRRDRGARVDHPVHASRSTRSAGRRSRCRAGPAEDGLPGVGPARRAARATMRSCSAPGSRSRRLCGAEARERGSRVRARARRRGRRDHAAALPGTRPARRDEARPDARQRGRPRGRGGDPRARRAARPGEGVLGEEFGDDGSRRPLDRRPDRRDAELRPRRPRLGDAARARARGHGRRRRRLGAGAQDAAGGRRAARAPGPATRRATRRSRPLLRVEDAVISTTTESEMPPGWRELAARAWTPAASATSGSTASSPRAPSTSPPTRCSSLWDYAAVQLIVEEAGGRCTTFAGDPPAPGESYLSANAALHETAVAVVQAARAPDRLHVAAAAAARRCGRGEAVELGAEQVAAVRGSSCGGRRDSRRRARTSSSPGAASGGSAPRARAATRASRAAAPPRRAGRGSRSPASAIAGHRPASATRQSAVRAHAMSDTAVRSNDAASSS